LGEQENEEAHIEQQITVSPTAPYLAYWHWIDSQDICPSSGFRYDFATILVNGKVERSYDLCVNNNTGSWKKQVVDLRGYAGQTAVLRLAVKTDYSLRSSLFLDDISFQASATLSETP
jgi:hypothetical protein